MVSREWQHLHPIGWSWAYSGLPLWQAGIKSTFDIRKTCYCTIRFLKLKQTHRGTLRINLNQDWRLWGNIGCAYLRPTHPSSLINGFGLLVSTMWKYPWRPEQSTPFRFSLVMPVTISLYKETNSSVFPHPTMISGLKGDCRWTLANRGLGCPVSFPERKAYYALLPITCKGIT